MARFKIGDRVVFTRAFHKLYEQVGTVQGQHKTQVGVSAWGQIYPVYEWKVKFDNGDEVVIHERYLELTDK